MKTLYLVRHAKAEDIKLGVTDFDRILTSQGQEQAREVAIELNKDLVKVDIIQSSSAARAMTTAQIIAQGLQYPINRIEPLINLYQPSITDMQEIIEYIDPNYNHVMLVGHNPTISQLAQRLCYAVKIDLSPCGVVALKFDVQSWREVTTHPATLLYIIQPK